MKIERVVVRELRALRNRDDSLVRHQKTTPALCLRGLNGSGKTTYLEMLAQLWQWFRRCTQRRGFVAPVGTPLLAEAKLVAALFTGLPGPRARMWIAWGTPEELRTLPEEDSPYRIHDNQVTWNQEILEYWDQATASAETGAGGDGVPPNVVYIGAENKYVPEVRRQDLASPRPAPSFVPVARYLPEARGPSHLEALLRTLFLARRKHWDILRNYLGELRPGLGLLEQFDDNQRPLFRLPQGELLTVDRLSAGERSLLINIVMILRWLGPGGLVLLDEPELHQHISLMRGSLSVIEAIVSDEFHGQLLVASHAPEVWDYFRPTDTILDLEEQEA